MRFISKKPNFTLSHGHIQKQELPQVPKIKSRKLADKKARNPAWKTVHKVADSRIKDMQNSILKSMNKVIDNIDLKSLQIAFEEGNINAVSRFIPFDIFEDELIKSSDILADVYLKTGSDVVKNLPGQAKKAVFNPLGARVTDELQILGQNLYKNVATETNSAMAQQIRNSFIEDIKASNKAKNIRELFGLNRRQANAVTNFRKQLIEAGAKPRTVDIRTKQYANKLRKYRAGVIAREELIKSANEGYIEMVRQAREQNLLVGKTFKIWVVTPDDRLCPICRPLDGQKQPMEQPFITSVGQTMIPHAHISCRCSMRIVTE